MPWSAYKLTLMVCLYEVLGSAVQILVMEGEVIYYRNLPYENPAYIDINECEGSVRQCNITHSHCNNILASFTCECDAGFIMEDGECERKAIANYYFTAYQITTIVLILCSHTESPLA